MKVRNVGEKRFPRRFLKINERGNVLVELALCGIVYAVFLVGITDLSQVLLRQHQLTQIARECARIASITGNINTDASRNAVIARMGPILERMRIAGDRQPAITINFTPPDGITSALIDVSVEQPIRNFIASSVIPGLTEKTIQARISMPYFST